MAHRQFVQRDNNDVVLCEWDARKGTWRCTSAPGSPYNMKVESLSNVVQLMKADGFEEITPTLRRVGRVSKEGSGCYPALPIVAPKSVEVISVQFKNGHPSKDPT